MKGNKIGQQSIALGNYSYKTSAKPVMGLLSGPYQFVSPYVRKADEVGDKTLSRIDEQFPVVTKPTADVYADTKSLVFYPYNKSLDTTKHIYKVYGDERKQFGPGVFPLGKAIISTALVVTGETLAWVRTVLTSVKEKSN